MKYVLHFLIAVALTLPHPALLAAQPVADSASAEKIVDVFDVQNLDLQDVCAELTAQTGVSITVDPQLKANVSLYVENVSVEEILKIIVDAKGMAYLVAFSSSGKKSFEVVSPDTYQQQRGRSFGQDRISRVLAVNNAKPGDVLRRLESLKSPDGKLFAYDSQKTIIVIDRPAIVADMLNMIEMIDVSTEMRTFEFHNVSAEQLLPGILEILSPHVGRAEMHQAAKRVTVTDAPERLDRIDQMIKVIDNNNRSVSIDVKVLQIVLSDEYQKGVDWPAIVSNYKNMKFIVEAEGDLTENFSVGTVSGEDFQVLLNSLDVVGIIQEVNNESLTVKNGSSADVLVRSVDLVLKSDREDDVERVEHREAIGFEMAVGLADQRRVLLHLAPRVSAYKERIWLDKFYTSHIDRDFMPLKDKGAVEVAPGETLVVGGLFKNVTVESTRSIIPFLGKIPLLGFAFRNQGQEVRKAEMILFLTPRLDPNE